MTEPRPTFLEQFDRSGTYRKTRRRQPTAVASMAVLVVLLVAGVAALLWLFVLDEEAKTAEEWLDQGLSAHVERRFSDAAEAYQEVLLLDPTNKFAHYNLGLLAQTANRPDDAERSYRQALLSDPAYVPALFNLAILRSDDGDNEEAVELYRIVLGIEPDNADAHLNLGFALRALGREDEGDLEIARAISLDPELRARVTRIAPSTSPEDSSATTTTTMGSTTTTTEVG